MSARLCFFKWDVSQDETWSWVSIGIIHRKWCSYFILTTTLQGKCYSSFTGKETETQGGQVDGSRLLSTWQIQDSRLDPSEFKTMPFLPSFLKLTRKFLFLYCISFLSKTRWAHCNPKVYKVNIFTLRPSSPQDHHHDHGPCLPHLHLAEVTNIINMVCIFLHISPYSYRHIDACREDVNCY